MQREKETEQQKLDSKVQKTVSGDETSEQTETDGNKPNILLQSAG